MSVRTLRRGTMAAGRVASSVVVDSFDRANSATTLGVADTGQAWVPIGATWGISSNQAYQPTPTNHTPAFINAGISDGTFLCDVKLAASGDGVMFRALGAAVDDGFLFYLSTSGFGTQLLVPGFGTSLIQAGSAGVAGNTYQLKVVLLGASISCYRDNVLMGTVSNSTQQTATRFGIRGGGGSGGRWDTLSVAA